MVNDLGPIGEQAHSEELLKPYVPRVLIQWLRDGAPTPHRAIDGSLAFVDISGFTELTERLARRGKIGAELLRDTLDGVFSALLDEAYEWGAGLVKWGGDALLLLFDDPEHERRAARAAWEMQRTIERVGRLRVGGTVVMLRMSVGIATGTSRLLRRRELHRELLIAGPTATETVQIEAEADAGEIGISSALAEALDPRASERARSRGSFSSERRMPCETVLRTSARCSGLDVASCIPVASRAHVLLERTEPEHRTVAAAFIDLMNTDVLLARLGPAALADELDAADQLDSGSRGRAHDVPFNLTDISNGSIKALLTAGAPSTTGHDEEQILRTLREVMDRPGIIPMRAGVEVGGVFTGDFGPPYRRAVCRFRRRGQHGGARDEPRRSGADPFDRASTGSLAHDLRDDSDRAFSRQGEGGSGHGPRSSARSRAGAASATWRRRSSAATRSWPRSTPPSTSSGPGRGSVVEISGAAGIGKSRLVTELVESSPDVQVLRAVCEEYEAFTPYFALRAPMRSVLELAAGSDDIEAEARLREVAASGRSRARRVGAAARDPSRSRSAADAGDEPDRRTFSPRRARRRDGALPRGRARRSAATAGRRGRRLPGRGERGPAAAALAVRSCSATRAAGDSVGSRSDVGRPGGRHPSLGFTLLPLSVERAAEIVAMATDRQPLRPHDVEEIAERSGGSPLFLFELLDVTRVTGTTDSLPGSVEAVVAAEIDRLSPSDRTVVRYASVLGVRFDARVACGRAPGAGRDRRGNLATTRRADRARPRRRPALSQRARSGGRLRGSRLSPPARAARAGGGDDRGNRSVALRRRRRRSRSISSRRSAATRRGATAGSPATMPGQSLRTWRQRKFYERALAAAGRLRDVDDRERAAVLVALGAVREAAGLFDSSYDALRRATRLLRGDPVEQARVYGLRTRARIRTGSYTNALRETSCGPASRRGSRLGRGNRSAGDAARDAKRDLDVAGPPARGDTAGGGGGRGRPERADEFEALRHAYTALDGAYQMLGQPERAVHERMSLDLYTRPGDTRRARDPRAEPRRPGLCRRQMDRGCRSSTIAPKQDLLAAGDRPNAAIAKTNLGELLVSRGRLAEAERALGDARRVLRSTRYVPFALFAETQLARIALARGDAEGALESLTAHRRGGRGKRVRGLGAGEVRCTSRRRRQRRAGRRRASSFSTMRRAGPEAMPFSTPCPSTACVAVRSQRWDGWTRRGPASTGRSPALAASRCCTSSCSPCGRSFDLDERERTRSRAARISARQPAWRRSSASRS